MKLPIQVVFRDVVALPWLEEDIRRRAEKLEQFTPHLMSCHVAVESVGHHQQQGRQYVVKIDLRVPGAEIFAGEHHANEDIAIAVRGAFDAVRRRLEDFERRRRGQVKRQPAAVDAQMAELVEPPRPEGSPALDDSLIADEAVMSDSGMTESPDGEGTDPGFLPDEARSLPGSASDATADVRKGSRLR